MFAQVTLQDWENLVKKQLKTEDIYAVLTKENLEGISVKPYYADTDFVLKKLQVGVSCRNTFSINILLPFFFFWYG